MYDLLDLYFSTSVSAEEKRDIVFIIITSILYYVPIKIAYRIVKDRENGWDLVLAILHFFVLNIYYIAYLEGKHHVLTNFVSVIFPYVPAVLILFIYLRKK